MTDDPVQRYVLKATPPVRPLAIGAGSVVVGAVLLVLWRGGALPVGLAVLGGVLMVLGILLAVAAVVLAARLRTEVSLDAGSIAVVRSGQRRSLPWSEVREVALAHPRLILRTDDPARALSLVNPRSPQDPRFQALLRGVQQRLDSDRGYQNL